MTLDRVLAARATMVPWLALADETLTCFPLPGGVLTISDHTGVLAQSAFGLADVARGTPMRVDHRFEIGSISKTFTAWVVLALIEQGLIDANAPVQRYLDWVDLGPLADEVTIERLLNHTAGTVLGADALPDDVAEILHSAGSVPTSSPVAFRYSNLGYLLLGQVVATVSGRSLADGVKGMILDPLSMSETLAEVPFDARALLAPGHWPSRPDQPWMPGDSLSEAAWFELDAASGNVVSTGADMARFSAAVLGAARDEPVRGPNAEAVMTREQFDRMTTTLARGGEACHVPPGALAVTSSRYGLGVNVEVVNGALLVTHGGGMVGYSTFWLVDVTNNIAITVLTNANGDSYVSHVLARWGHAAMLRELNGSPEHPATSLNPLVGPDHPGCATGTFYSDRDGKALTISARGREISVQYANERGQLFALFNGRWGTNNPALRRFYLDPVTNGAGWTWGDHTFLEHPPATFTTPSRHPLVGHYRSYSPWYPEFRIIERSGVLLLSASGGTEAPQSELELRLVSPGVWATEGEGPERLRSGPVVRGWVSSVDRDGCVYSRVFSA